MKSSVASQGVSAGPSPSNDRQILLSAQSLAVGNGGICAVARMTALALARRYRVEVLACQDQSDQRLDSVPVRSFSNQRLMFALANLAAAQRATHVMYDFAGTARAHIDIPFCRRPYAVWIHSLEVWEGAPKKYLRAVASADLVIANSAYTLARAGSRLPKQSDIIICPLGTLEETPPATIGPAAGPPTVMLLGRADEIFAKGHDLLIAAWPTVVAAVPNAKLLLVGGGCALDRVRGLAAASSARDSIEIPGFVPEKMIEQYWQRATTFAMLGYTEGFGIVYVEAMRRGLPVIASTDDAGQEINIDGATGFNVGRKNKTRLTEALVALLRDRDLAHRFGAAAHARWRENYTFSAFELRFAAAIQRFVTA